MNIETITEQWRPFVNEAAGGVRSAMPAAREAFVAQVATNKQWLNESAGGTGGAMMPGMFNGIGAVQLPASPGSYADFSDPSRQVGSGDAITTLGMAMTIASQTIAFDLLPTVPVYSELILLDYLDVVYSGGRFDGAIKPQIFSINQAVLAADTDLVQGSVITLFTTTVGNNPAGQAIRVKFLQKHRTKADTVIVQYVGVASTFIPATPAVFTANEVLTLNGVRTTINAYVVGITGTPTVISITAGSLVYDWTSAVNSHQSVGSNDGDISGDPMNRQSAEQNMGAGNEVEIRTYQKSIQTNTYENRATVSRQQARALKSKGVESMPIIKTALANVVTQSINKDILRRMRALGVSNHYELLSAQGLNLNLFIAPGTTAQLALTSFSAAQLVDARGVNRTSAFGDIRNSETNSAAENRWTRALAISGRIQAACSVIGTVSKFGAGDFAVVGPQVAAALKNAKAYTPIQYEGTLTSLSSALYFLGDIGGVRVYCDPNMDWQDGSILVGRSNKTASGLDYQNLNQGLVFCAYDLAASVEAIAESTMAPHVMMESVYALAETGVQPQLAYLTFSVHTGFGAWV